jgi:abhydrolase domain-containing protein 17
MQPLLLTVLGLYALVAVATWFVADRLIFLPPASSYTAGDLPVVMIPGEGESRIATLHLPARDSRFTILYSHGNAEDLGHLAGLLEEFRARGYGVIGYDYRGYGMSTGGPPGARAASRDLRAVYEHATDELGIDPSRMILLGRSVGSGPATELAAEEPVAGLVLESAFVSAFRVVTRVRLLPYDPFPNLRLIRRVGAPVLVIHGTADQLIPLSHGRRLLEAAPGPKQAFWVEGAGHNDLMMVAGERYWRALERFVQSIPAPAGSRR